MDITSIIATTVNTDWKDILLQLIQPYKENVNLFLNKEYETYKDVLNILPSKENIFKAFNHFDFKDLKVIVLAQDPYPNSSHAMGLAFSIPNNSKTPPSLKNIFKELENEYGEIRTSTDLSDWANQGVLLLNTALTVREGCSGSHIKIWKLFTRDILNYIASNNKYNVYLLWGNLAIAYKELIKEDNLVLTHSHPSPLSCRPFIGNNHFKLCNDYLSLNNKIKIKWI
jgi:uracil-DNA glycosylase